MKHQANEGGLGRLWGVLIREGVYPRVEAMLF